MNHQHFYNGHLAQGGGATAHTINGARRRDVTRALIGSATQGSSSTVKRRCAASGIETQIIVLARGQHHYGRHHQTRPPPPQLSRSIAQLLPVLATNSINSSSNQYQEQKDAKTQSTAVGSVALSTLAAMLSSSGMERAHSKLSRDFFSTFPSSGHSEEAHLSAQAKGSASREILSALRRRSCGGSVSSGVDGIIGSATPSPEGLDAFEQFVHEAIYSSSPSVVSLVIEALLLGHDVEIICPAACGVSAVPLVSFARDSVMTDLPEFTIETSEAQPTTSKPFLQSLKTVGTSTHRENVNESEAQNNNSSNPFDDDEDLFFPTSDVSGRERVDGADLVDESEEKGNDGGEGDDDLFFPCSVASPAGAAATTATTNTSHTSGEGTSDREGAADDCAISGVERSNENALSGSLVASIAFSPSLSVLPQLYTATLCSFLLHITAQPVLDYNQGPMGIIIGASQQQCHEICAVLAPLAEQLQLVVHNVFGPIPLMPQNRRADIVVGTAVRICNGIVPTNHPRSVHHHHHHHQQGHLHHQHSHAHHNNNNNNKENPLVPLYWPCCSFPEACPLDASPESAAAFHYYSLAHVSQLLAFVEDCLAEGAEEDEEPKNNEEERKFLTEEGGANKNRRGMSYTSSLEKAALERIIGTTQRHQHHNNNNNTHTNHHQHNENSRRRRTQPLFHYEGPNKGILPTCQITIVRNRTRTQHQHHYEELQDSLSSSLLDLHYQKPEVMGAAAVHGGDVAGGQGRGASSAALLSPQPLRIDLRSFDMSVLGDDNNYDKNNKVVTETLTMAPTRGRRIDDEGQGDGFVRIAGGKRQRSVSPPTNRTTDPRRENEEEIESLPETIEERLTTARSDALGHHRSTQARDNEAGTFRTIRARERCSTRKLLALYIHNVSTPLRWEQLKWSAETSSSFSFDDESSGDPNESHTKNGGTVVVGGKLAHPISKVAISAFISLLDENKISYDPSSVTAEEVFSCARPFSSSDTLLSSSSSFASADLLLKVEIRSSDKDSYDRNNEQQRTAGRIENEEAETEHEKEQERHFLALLCQKFDGSAFDGVRNVVCEAKLLQDKRQEKGVPKSTFAAGDAANSIAETMCYYSQHALLMRFSSDRGETLSSSLATDQAAAVCVSETVRPPQHHWLPFLIGTEQQQQPTASDCGDSSNSCLLSSSVFPLCREISGFTSRGDGHSSKLHYMHPRSGISEFYHHSTSAGTSASEHRFAVLLKRFLPVLELKFEAEEEGLGAVANDENNNSSASALTLTELDALVLSRKHVGELISKVMLSSASPLTPRYGSPTAASGSPSSSSPSSSSPSSDSGPSLSRAHVDSAAHVLLKVIRQALCDQGAGVLGGRADQYHGGGVVGAGGGLHFVGGEASFVVCVRNKKETAAEQQFCGEDVQTLVNVPPSLVSPPSAFLMEVGLAVPVPSWQQAVALSSYLSGSRVPNGPSDGNQQTYYSILSRMGFSEGRSLHYYGLKKPLAAALSSSSSSSSVASPTTMNESVSRRGSFTLSVSAADPASWRAEQSVGLLSVPMILKEDK